MPHCYLLTLCLGSSSDKFTNNYTLFSLIEQIATSAENLGQAVPIEVHAHFVLDEGDKRSPFEMRVIRKAADGTEDAGPPLPFDTEDLLRYRIRVAGLRLPAAFGSYTLRLEWRRRGTELWHAESVWWPLVVQELPIGSAATQPTPLSVS